MIRRIKNHLGLGAALVAVLAVATLSWPSTAETVKVGVLPSVGDGAIYIAKDRGYFNDNDIDLQIINFDAGQPIAVATVSGDLDFGAAGVTSALYTLAADGALKIIAGFTSNGTGFHTSVLVQSNQSYANGLASLKDIGGHSFGLTQVGSTYHYMIALIAQKYDIDFKTIKMLPLQSMANIASAIAGGQADMGVLLSPIGLPLIDRGNARLLAWPSDEAPFQTSVIWTATKTANERGDLVRRFLSAVRHGAHDYNAAFMGPDRKPKVDQDAEDMLALLAKYSTQSITQEKASLSYMDADNRLDVKDLQRQIDWYRSQGMLKGDFGVDQVVDRRYIVPLP